MRHPHADVAIAWFNDPSINLQFKEPYDEKWTDFHPAADCIPQFHCQWSYRIKPKTLKYRVALMRRGVNAWAVIYDGQDTELDSQPDHSDFARWVGPVQEIEL
jgi:hypothetical protein